MATIKDFEITSSGNNTTKPIVTSASLDNNTLAVEFDSIVQYTTISRNRFKVKNMGKKVKVISATIAQGDSYVYLELNPRHSGSIDVNSMDVTLSYRDPKGDQTSKVIQDLFGNDLDSFSNYGVEII